MMFGLGPDASEADRWRAAHDTQALMLTESYARERVMRQENESLTRVVEEVKERLVIARRQAEIGKTVIKALESAGFRVVNGTEDDDICDHCAGDV